MIGLLTWIVVSGALAGGLMLLGLFPDKHPDSYATSMICVLIGLGFGGWVNGLIRDNWPNVDRWNCS
jgi:hypothetical protein